MNLDPTQQTLLIPLYARAAETRRRWPLLRDPMAGEILAAIDYDLDRLKSMGQGLRGAVLRTVIYDAWARDFLERHPDGTVVEIGTGLNTRFERLDNGRVRWFDLDLPEVTDLRRRFFSDTDRRTMIAASVLDREWIDVVRAAPGPYLLLAEAVLLYLTPQQVREALTMIAEAFPGAGMVLDTGTRRMADGLAGQSTMRHMGATMAWTCERPSEVEQLVPAMRLTGSRTLMPPPAELHERLPLPSRLLLAAVGRLFRSRLGQYHVNLFQFAQ